MRLCVHKVLVLLLHFVAVYEGILVTFGINING